MKLPDQTEPILRIPAPVKKAVGLGDAVKNLTRAVGISPCQGCRRRAATLNRLIGFAPPRGGHRGGRK